MRYHSPQSWKKGRKKQAQKKVEKKLAYKAASSKKLPSLKQLKYISRVLPAWQMWIIRILIVVIVVNGGYLGWKYYESHTVTVAKNGGSYTEGLVGSPKFINPVFLQNNDADRDIARLIYAGLLKYDTSRTVQPDLAESYTISDDGKSYTFKLRQDARWHDGEPFNADDVVFTISRIQDPATKSPLYLSFRDVKAEKTDDYTVVFTLPKPFAPFLDLTTVGVLPEHVWGDVVAENFNVVGINTKPVGIGPFKFKSLQKAKDGSIRTYVIERNEDYYNKQPYLDKITFKFYPDTDSAVQALKNRNVDGISFLPRDLRDKLEHDQELKYYTFNLPEYTALFLNQENNPDIESKAVRQALAVSIDKDRIVREVLADEGHVIDEPILPGFLGYHEGVKKYNFDLAKANDLLETAGWEKNADGLWARKEKVIVKEEVTNEEGETELKEKIEEQDRILTVNLVTVNQQEKARVAQIVEEGWNAAGINVDLQLVDPSRIKSEVIDARAYDAFLYGEIIGSDPDLYPFWHSSQAKAPGLNLSSFSNEKADKLLVDARQTSDTEKRQSLYEEFQDILAEEVPAVFLYNPNYNYVVASEVKGISPDKHIVHASDRFLDISFWHTKLKRVWPDQANQQ